MAPGAVVANRGAAVKRVGESGFDLPELGLPRLVAGGREPVRASVRNAGPLFCNRKVRLQAWPGDGEWRLVAEDPDGRAAVEMVVA